MIDRIKEVWESAMRVVELGVSILWVVASLVLLVLLFFGYGDYELKVLIYIGFSFVGILQWKWRRAVWPSLRKHHGNHQ